MTKPIEDRIGWERKNWIAERIGWVLMGLLVIGALLGLFGGSGVFNKPKESNLQGVAMVVSPRIWRMGVTNAIEVRFTTPTKVFYMDSEVFGNLKLIQIQPGSSSIGYINDKHVYEFHLPQATTQLYLEVEPVRGGKLSSEATSAAGSLPIHAIVLP